MWVEIEIMKIIEPYMDKTLSEGCIVKTVTKGIPKHLWTNFDYVSLAHWKDSYRTLAHNWRWEYKDVHFDDPYYSEIKILWYYDITAVLKYIKSTNKCAVWMVEIEWELINIKIEESWKWFSLINKPLILYTEQENTLLLKILKELCE